MQLRILSTMYHIHYSRGNKDVPETQKSAEKRPKHTSGHTSQAQKGGF